MDNRQKIRTIVIYLNKLDIIFPRRCFVLFGIVLPALITTQQMTMPRLNIYYPVVSGLAKPAVQQKINEDVLNLENIIIKDQGYYGNHRTEIWGSYEIKTNEKGILSISIFNDAYSGGVHGLDILKSLTIDTDTGRVYSLKDLFREGVDYVGILSEIIRRQIKERNIYLLREFRGIRPDQDYYIADRSLVVYFQLYEIAPYASGFPYFPISVYELKNILNDKGPLYRFLYS